MSEPESGSGSRGGGSLMLGRFFFGFCDRSVILTYIGIVFSVIGILCAFRGELAWAMICLILVGVCDMTDGTIARSCTGRSEDEKAFGIQMDSLADALGFVALPVAISIAFGNDDIISIAVCALYAIAGLVRLAYFNVQSAKSEVKVFTGLPVTSVVLVFPFLWLIAKYVDGFWTTVLFDVCMAALAVLFVSRLRIKKPGRAVQIAFAAIAAVGVILLLILRTISFRCMGHRVLAGEEMGHHTQSDSGGDGQNAEEDAVALLHLQDGLYDNGDHRPGSQPDDGEVGGTPVVRDEVVDYLGEQQYAYGGAGDQGRYGHEIQVRQAVHDHGEQPKCQQHRGAADPGR